MADTKVVNFPPSTGLVLTDIFPVIDDPGGAPDDQKATFAQLATLLSGSFAAVGSGVTSFNTRTGAVTLLLSDVSGVADARYVLKTGDTMTGALAIGNGSLIASAPVLSLSQTWNNAAVLFTGFLYNVTDTASTVNSNLFNFQLDASDRFTFTNAGQFTVVRQGLTNSGVGFTLRKRGSSVSATGLVTDNSTLANINFSGWDGVAFATGNRISSLVQADWSAANHGAALAFFATPTGTTTETAVLTLLGTDVVLQVSLRTPYVAKVATYTATSLDYTIDCTSGTFTINLPTAVGITGRIYVIKNSGVGTITIDPSAAQTIDGLATSPVVSGAAATIQSNGANWIII